MIFKGRRQATTEQSNIAFDVADTTAVGRIAARSS
jgi:hypothetical protein